MQVQQIALSEHVSGALAEVVDRVRRSLVVVQNGGRGAGAGIVWRREGVVLTNNHVIHRGRPRVILNDGETYPAEIIDRDPEVDLALLRIDGPPLSPARIAGAPDLRVGGLVIAVGHPWGQRDVVTMGVISALGTAMTEGPRGSVPIIRTDVTLAPGNSGGPLVNAAGEVVGINTMIVGGDQGVAIRSPVAVRFVAEALDREVALGVGVQVTPLPASIRSELQDAQASGLLVVEVAPDGAAERAGVLPGDILVAVDEVALPEPRALLSALVGRSPGQRVPLRVLRGGRWREVEAELDSRGHAV